MKFIDPSENDLYYTLKNNHKLERFFIKNNILVGMDDYYENYGYNNKNKDSANIIIDEENDRVYRNLAKLFLGKLDEIKSQSISALVSKQFLKEDIKFALGFTEDVDISDDILWEIYYCLKYCYTDSFFQNNWENFVPKFDYEQMENNEILMAFMDSVMKEFDKLDNILDNFGDYRDYRKIPQEYIVYLTQLLGVEPKTFMLLNTQYPQYRELAENILDVYSKKGTAGEFEILFNFLGYKVDIEQYFFDRRMYSILSEENVETSTADKYKFQFYLTTKDPRYNLLNELGTNEIVTPKDISEKKDIRNFNGLVDEYGIRCVLGYDSEYIKTTKDENGVPHYEVKEYKGDVYKYFRTNYVRVKPGLKYKSGNLSLEQLYQLSAILNFLIPEFLQREMYVYVDIGESDEKMVMNWNRDYVMDDFYILDSEDWNNNQAKYYISNFYDSNEGIGYLNSNYTILPKRLKNNGTTETYVNSLGMSEHYAGGKLNNVFFNPMAEKIKIINSTRYWGDKIKIDEENADMYPVYRISENYLNEGKSFYFPRFLDKKGNQIVRLSLPKDKNYLPSYEQLAWDQMEQVSLNGFNGPTLKNKIREKSYGVGKWNVPYDDHSEESNERIIYPRRTNVEYVIDEPLKDFLDTSTDEETWSEIKKEFFSKDFVKTDNYNWKIKSRLKANETLKLESFIKNHKNIINYDYVNKKLFSFVDFQYLNFSDNKDRVIVKTPKRQDRNQYNIISTEMINSIIEPFDYFITLDATGSNYYIYQYVATEKDGNVYFKNYRPVPVYERERQETNYKFDTYKKLLETIDKNKFTYTYGRVYEIKNSSDIRFYVIQENMYYKPIKVVTPLKEIRHSNDNSIEMTMLEANKEITKNEKVLGSFYINNYNEFDDEVITENSGSKRAEAIIKRTPVILQYKYTNIKRGALIYSKPENKLYRILQNGCFATNENIMVTGKLLPSGVEKCVEADGGVYGVEEINFYGRFVLDNDKAYIYEYDESYPGFSEQDDDDNYIFNNYDREILWEPVKIATENVKKYVGEDSSIKNIDSSYTILTNKRPIKVNIDKIYDEKDGEVLDTEGRVISKNNLAEILLKEICDSYGSDYPGKDKVSFSNEID